MIVQPYVEFSFDDIMELVGSIVNGFSWFFSLTFKNTLMGGLHDIGLPKWIINIINSALSLFGFDTLNTMTLVGLFFAGGLVVYVCIAFVIWEIRIIIDLLSIVLPVS